jgi:hypothetical protein
LNSWIFGKERVMKKIKALLTALAIACVQPMAFAHPPILLIRVPHLRFPFTPGPGSLATKAFVNNFRTIAQGSLNNTVLTAPLNHLSGQFTGVAYYSYTNANAGKYVNYYNFPDTVYFGAGPMNNGAAGGTHAITSLGNSLTTGLHTIPLLPSKIIGHVSGAERAVLNYYDQAATGGYNTGISVLQHPTGGLLFGTTYYDGSPGSMISYPGFQAFGSNPYASSAIAQASLNGLTLSPLPASYIQFGKFVRPISNGFLFGTQYYPQTYNPPYVAGPGPYYGDGYFAIAIGSNPLNSLFYGRSVMISILSSTFFK